MSFRADPAGIAEAFPSFRDFVDDALFHPSWGYYSTGQVRFGDGGHYDTFPTALSPYFGRMIAGYAFRTWQRFGRPNAFEITEIGAGNGQLCLDTMLTMRGVAARHASWRPFVEATRYRIIERSPGLVARQRRQLAGSGVPVRWTNTDLSQGRPRAKSSVAHGLIVANEVLDCLSHHKVVPHRLAPPGLTYVIPSVSRAARGVGHKIRGIDGRAIPRASVSDWMAHETRARDMRFTEYELPLTVAPDLDRFLRRYCPFLYAPTRQLPPYFACPDIATLMRNTAGMYQAAEALWIDYGDERRFHLRAPESRKLFAGPPRSKRGPYDAPGRDDITFMVDFTLAARCAADAGWTVKQYGPQSDLVELSGVEFDEHVEETIVQHRALKWMLAVAGADPESDWRAGSVSFKRKGARGPKVRDDVKQTIAEVTGKRPSAFKLMILERR